MKNKLTFACLALLAAIIAGAYALDTPSLSLPDHPGTIGERLRWHASINRTQSQGIVESDAVRAAWRHGYLVGKADAYDHAADLVEDTSKPAALPPRASSK